MRESKAIQISYANLNIIKELGVYVVGMQIIICNCKLVYDNNIYSPQKIKYYIYEFKIKINIK